MAETEMFGMRMPVELKERAMRIAREDHRTLTSLIIKLLADHCQAWEGRSKEAAD